MFTTAFVLLCISTFLLVFMAFYIMSIKEKTQLHYAFFATIVFMFIYSLGCVLEKYFILNYEYKGMFFAYMAYLGFTFLPVFFMTVGYNYAYKNMKLSKYLLLLVIPVVSNMVLWTNTNNKLFYEKYFSLDSIDNLFGIYGVIHSLYSYACISIGLYFLIRFSINKSGLLSKQAILIILGSIVPFGINILYTIYLIFRIKLIPGLNSFVYHPYSTPVMVSIAIFCYAIAIFKYDFLKIIPIAFERVFNRISDSIIIISNEQSNYKILNFNQSFKTTFEELIEFDIGDNFFEKLKILRDKNTIFGTNEEDIIERLKAHIKKSAKMTKSIKIPELNIRNDNINFNKWINIEISCVDENRDTGTIILFKDITETKKYIEHIKQTQEVLAKQDRLATLGQLAGGIAHEINNPANAVQTGLYGVKLSMEEIKSAKTNEEILQIVNDANKILDNCNKANRKVLEIAASVKNHTRNLSKLTLQNFDIKEFIDKEMFMLEHLFKKSKCTVEIIEKNKLQITSDPGQLSQVILNLVSNAVQAYGEHPGIIQIIIYKIDDTAVIAVKDFAGGIPENIKNGVFKQILSTKGSNGTGFGLFISHTIVTGNLSGKLWFETVEKEGTIFYVQIPIEVK